MSFRELRSFTETMRQLGYQRIISVESFRQPNVELVADVLFWLVKRYDPSADIAFEISRESDRVFFFRQVCEAVLAKSRIKLNIKRLYQADGYAVREMLKLANVLKQATRLRAQEDADYSTLQAHAAQHGHNEAKQVRQLCTDLTNEGSTLFFLLEQEIAARVNRERVLSRATEIGEFERRLRDLLQSVTEQVTTLQQNLANLGNDETSLEQKIENKKAQLERAQKRLRSLMAVRPAFMEEYERYELELHQQFVVYLEQYRNLEFLEHRLAKFNRFEDELLAEQELRLRVMREKLRKEELKALRGDFAAAAADDGGGSTGEGAAQLAARKAAMMNQQRADHSRNDTKRPRAASGRTRPSPAAAVVASGMGPSAAAVAAAAGIGGGAGVGPSGNMYGPGDDDDDDDDDDSDDDSDIDDSDGSLSINNAGDEDSDEDSDSDDDEDDSDEDDSDEDDSDEDSDEDY